MDVGQESIGSRGRAVLAADVCLDRRSTWAENDGDGTGKLYQVCNANAPLDCEGE